MANQKTRAKTERPQSKMDMAEMEKRIEALERRVAVLEARMPQPTLAERVANPGQGKRIGIDQDQ